MARKTKRQVDLYYSLRFFPIHCWHPSCSAADLVECSFAVVEHFVGTSLAVVDVGNHHSFVASMLLLNPSMVAPIAAVVGKTRNQNQCKCALAARM